MVRSKSHLCRVGVRLRFVALVCIASSAACRGLIGVPSSTDAPVLARRSEPPAIPLARWPIKTASHVDLWLHAFAMLSEDTAAVPSFRMGYRDSLTVVKNRANVLTLLDTSRPVLAKRLSASPGYLQAQTLAFEFDSWDALRVAAERFVLADGDNRRVLDRAPVDHMVQFTRLFPTTADREWLRVFVAGVQDEQSRFFGVEHTRIVRTRSATITAVDSLWQKVYRVRFERFLTNTGQRSGDVILSTPLGGDGRAARGPERQSVLAVPFPERVSDANEVILVLAHEMTRTLTLAVVAGLPIGAERRTTIAGRYVLLPQVRAGAMLLERVAPELLEPYMRFYLRQSGLALGQSPVGTTSTGARPTVVGAAEAFEHVFSIPVSLRDGLRQQVDLAVRAN